MSRDTIRQYANLFTVILALTVNLLASTLPLNGQNTGEISDRFDVFFVRLYWLRTVEPLRDPH